jgi:phosphomannomutase
MRPVNLGAIPTPALTCYALARGKGSIMVTGSHIPFDRHGYKTNTSKGELLKQQEAPIHEQVRKVRQSLYDQPRDQSPFDERRLLQDRPPGSSSRAAGSPRCLDRAIHQLLPRVHLSQASGSWSINTPRWGETCWWRSCNAWVRR